MEQVYITSAGRFLPGKPISNKDMEEYLGLVDNKRSRYRSLVLRSNRIKTRYYALEKGRQTYLNEELLVNAIQDALDNNSGISLDDIKMLSVGTTIPDVIAPGFASMVHGRLGGPSMEISSSGGICGLSVAALKNAYQTVAMGQHDNAIAGASELSSAIMRGNRFKNESEVVSHGDKDSGYQYFTADFLRWMLSDGAGAFILQNKPNPSNISLRIDWIESASYANEFPTCMYMGLKDPKEALKPGNTWLSYDSCQSAERDGLLLLRQDTELLANAIMEVLKRLFRQAMQKGLLKPNAIDHFLPHISSFYFADKAVEAIDSTGIPLPREKWFTNLATVGNVGSASMFLMVEEALRIGLFEPGQRILVGVPESGRFSGGLIHLTCVGP